MAQLSKKVQLYLEANSKDATALFKQNKVMIQNNSDGNGDYIAVWDVDGLAKPSDDQIASYDSAGDTAITLRDLRYKRKTEYGDIGEQLDLLYKDIVADKLDTTGEWAKKIKAVKDANPK
tara:strand:- start:630 stop:989 length:360 start_codon:yes stop_codon:yes gene_type:complete